MASGMAAGQPSSSGQSPLDKERDRGPTEREQTPEAPGQKPEPGQEQPQPQPDEQKPDGKGPNPPHGVNRPNAPPRADEAGPPIVPGDDTERWGFLPERVQAVFRNQLTDDLPVQYRDWIDSYYRRLNRGR